MDQLIDLMLENQRDMRQVVQRLAAPQHSTMSSPEVSSDCSAPPPNHRAIAFGESAGASACNLGAVSYSHSEANLRAMQEARRSEPPRALCITSADSSPTRGRSRSLVPTPTRETAALPRVEEGVAMAQTRIRKISNPMPTPCSILINDTPIHELPHADHSTIPNPVGPGPGPLVPPGRRSFTKNLNARTNLSKSSSVYALCNRPPKKTDAAPRRGSLSDLLTATDESPAPQPAPVCAQAAARMPETPPVSAAAAAPICAAPASASSPSAGTPQSESAAAAAGAKQSSREQYDARRRKGRIASERTESIETNDSWPSTRHYRVGTTASTHSESSKFSSTLALAARASGSGVSSPPDTAMLSRPKKRVTIASPNMSGNRDPAGNSADSK